MVMRMHIPFARAEGHGASRSRQLQILPGLVYLFELFDGWHHPGGSAMPVVCAEGLSRHF